MIGLAGNVLGMAGVLANNAINSTAKTINNVFARNTQPDNSEVSQLAAILAQAQSSSSGMIIINGQPVDIAVVRQYLQENSALLKQALGKFCQENGIDIEQMFQIGLDAEGSIVISGDHSQRERIQELLRQDKNFTRLFRDTKLLSDYVSSHAGAAA